MNDPMERLRTPRVRREPVDCESCEALRFELERAQIERDGLREILLEAGVDAARKLRDRESERRLTKLGR